MENCKNYEGELSFDLPVGFHLGNEYVRAIELLKTNGIAEEVFGKKLPEKPYTWIGNVIAIATGKIGNIPIGLSVRDEYLKTGVVNIPSAIMRMPLADANTMLVEIHRRVWQNIIPKQEILCKYCAKSIITDVNLSKIEMSAEYKEFLEQQGGNPLDFIVVNLKDGFIANDWLKEFKKGEDFDYLKDINFNRMIFRVPTLGDAIRNEKLAVSDNLKFWRKLALDCLVSIEQIKEDKKLTDFPTDQLVFVGSKLFSSYLSSNDLREVRDCIREDCPTLPFDYTETCPCDRQREIPYAMEATNFFSV